MLRKIKIETLLLICLFLAALFLGLKIIEEKAYANHCVSCCNASKGEGWCGLCDECIGPANAPKTCSPAWCGGSPPPPPPPPCSCSAPSAPTITSPANGATGLNPDGLVVTWTIASWGIDSGSVPSCYNNAGNDRFYVYYRKSAGGTGDTPPAAPPGTATGGGWRYVQVGGTIRSYTLYNLDGQSTYQIYLVAHNGCSTGTSATITASTETRPAIASVTSATSCAADLTGTRWSGTSGANPRVLNPVNFTTVVSDVNGSNDISYVMMQIDQHTQTPEAGYKYLKAMYVRSRSGYTNNTFYLWDNGQWVKNVVNGAIDGANAKIHVGSGGSSAVQNGNNITITLRVEFEGTFTQGKHKLYNYVEDLAGAQDRKTGTVTTEPTSSPVGENWHQLANIPNWGVDTINPTATNPIPAVVDANTIRINWNGSDITSGLKLLDGFCWQTASVSSTITKVAPVPAPLATVLPNSDPDPSTNPSVSSNCSARFSNSPGAQFTYDLSRTSSDLSAFNFKTRVEDYACNIIAGSYTQSTNSPWLLTYGGNDYAESHNMSVPNTSINNILTSPGATGSLFSSFSNKFFSSFSSTPKVIAATTGQAFASSYILSAKSIAITSRPSSLNYSLSNYNDLNADAPAEVSTGSFYDYLLEVVESNVTVSDSTSLSLTGSSATAFGVVVGAEAHRKITGDVTIQTNFSCNTKTILFINGNLTIIPDMTISGFDNGCIIVANGNVTVENGTYRNQGNTSPGSLAYYDQIHAFIIVDGTFITKEDSQAAGAVKWDGLTIKGSVIAKSLQLDRDLFLLANLSQPSEAIVYDARYSNINAFRNALKIKNYSIREEGLTD